MNKVVKIIVSIVLGVGALCVGVLLAASSSKEGRANKLIKEQFFKTLYDFESYQPIETVVDSAFTSIYEDNSILNKIDTLLAYQSLQIEYLENALKYGQIAKSAKEGAEILYEYRTGIGSESYWEYQNRYTESYDLSIKYQELSNAIKEKYNELEISVRLDIQNFKREFLGWQAAHKFRCKTRGGQSSIANYIFVFDKEMKTIIRYNDIEDEEYVAVRKNIDRIISTDFSN